MKEKMAFGDYWLFAEAWLLLAISRLLLVIAPFKKIVSLMQFKGTNPVPDDKRLECLPRIQLAIARASTKSPWRTKCFEQALTAKMMTRRRGLPSVIYFGVKKETGSEKIDAHAWLKCGDFVVTGWQRMNSYTVVAEF
jgi:hypothetical protein